MMKSLGDFDLFFPVLLSRLSNLSPYVKLWFAYIYFCTGFFFFLEVGGSLRISVPFYLICVGIRSWVWEWNREQM